MPLPTGPEINRLQAMQDLKEELVKYKRERGGSLPKFVNIVRQVVSGTLAMDKIEDIDILVMLELFDLNGGSLQDILTWVAELSAKNRSRIPKAPTAPMPALPTVKAKTVEVQTPALKPLAPAPTLAPFVTGIRGLLGNKGGILSSTDTGWLKPADTTTGAKSTVLPFKPLKLTDLRASLDRHSNPVLAARPAAVAPEALFNDDVAQDKTLPGREIADGGPAPLTAKPTPFGDFDDFLSSLNQEIGAELARLGIQEDAPLLEIPDSQKAN